METINTRDTIRLIGRGRQDCSDMHSYGPVARQQYVIHYVIHGSGYLEYEHKCYPVKTGESFLICPYVVAKYYPDPGDPWEYTWVDFNGGEAGSLLEAGCMSRQSPVCPVIPGERILPIFERLCSLDIYHRNRQEAQGLLVALLGIYADSYPAPQPGGFGKADNRLETARILIRANYHHAYFHTENLCQALHCSRITLYRLFSDGLQVSPGRYLSMYRIAQACKMLRLGVAVKTVALSCGFYDPFYFSRTFKQYMGRSPAEYKKEPVELPETFRQCHL